MVRDDTGYLLRPIGDLDYHDTRSIELPATISPLEAWNLMTAEPHPVLRAAFGLRDMISARFGVKRIGGFSGTRTERIKVGDRLDFFLVEIEGPNDLVLTERDRHLDVMTSVNVDGPRLTITSSVVTHNAFGRAYMVPVGPAHKLIVAAMLRRLKTRMAARTTGIRPV